MAASSASAEDIYLPDPTLEILHVPEPNFQLDDPNLGTLSCYTLESFKTLLALDIDHQVALSDLEDLQAMLSLVENNLKDAQIINRASVRQYRIMVADRDRISEKWAEDNKKRHAAEASSVWDSWVTYGLIVAGTIAVTEGVVLFFIVQGD